MPTGSRWNAYEHCGPSARAALSSDELKARLVEAIAKL
jgi:hypothetical protein